MRKTILNTIYLVVVFIAVFAVAGLSLARKTNSLRLNANQFSLTINKDELIVSNAVAGTVEEVMVNSGQSIKEGDVLVRLRDELLESRLSTLSQFSSENLSAQTEAEVLKNNVKLLEIRAPRDGVVDSINVSVGSNLAQNSKVAVIFADKDVKLKTVLPAHRLSEIEHAKSFEALSTRLGLTYTVRYIGISKVDGVNPGGELNYELLFGFVDEGEGSAFLNGEILDVKWVENTTAKRPADTLTDFWNKLIIRD
mgnify:CR=1 FL=1